MALHVRKRYRIIAGLAVLGLVSSLIAAPRTAQAATTVPTAPTNLRATRSFLDPRDFTLTWTKATGPVHHYVVSMFADGKRSRITVPATSTRYAVDGTSLMTIYQVRVVAENIASMGTTSDELTVNPVLSGPPVNVLGSALPGGGIHVEWTKPDRPGLSPVLLYRVTFVDALTRRKLTLLSLDTDLDAPLLDNTRLYEVSVAAVTKDGVGLTETEQLGGATPTAPRWFTAVRDPAAPDRVVLSWTEPSWHGSSAISGYEVGSGSGSSTVSSWKAAGYVTGATLSLPAASTGMYSVRAVNDAGRSVGADLEYVDVAVRTQLVTSTYPISVTSSGRDVTVNFYTKLAGNYEKLGVYLLPTDGWTYRDERTINNGANLAVSFDNVPSGRYRLWVMGLDTQDPKASGTDLFNQEVIVNDEALSQSSVDVSFSEGTADWHGIYPPSNLPVVIMTDKLAYDGATSMAITAMANSVARNITAGAGPARAVPTAAGQQLVVAAQGFATTQPTQWNLGISWWNAKGEQISVVRTKRLTRTVGDWKPSGGTFTAPAGAVAASAFVEVGELLKGQTFYIDDIALRSFTPTPRVQSATDWAVVQGEAQVTNAAVVMPSGTTTEVIDTKTSGADLSVSVQTTLRSGSHYGLELRASRTAKGTTSYVMQLEQSSSGWAYVLRQQTAGATCSRALATSSVLSGLNPGVAHNVTVKISGDVLTVTLAGKQVLTVSSLAGAVKRCACGAAPAGTAVGLLKLGSSAVEFNGAVLVKS
ncbi:fibronectin type III domain-containing protein [Actinoplanes sp. NPDC049548]|uniref:fibronectin type III domain-containing protein n=1 Tax=Actinoplanes sp. NPDC049548 TaxID=3155152 RepID=UPI003433CD44